MVDPILTRARELIADPEHWTKFALAEDNLGVGTSPFDPDAYCFCLIGAMDRATAEHLGIVADGQDEPDDMLEAVEETPEFSAAIRRVHALLPGLILISDFNDDPETAHADVLALLDKANANA